MLWEGLPVNYKEEIILFWSLASYFFFFLRNHKPRSLNSTWEEIILYTEHEHLESVIGNMNCVWSIVIIFVSVAYFTIRKCGFRYNRICGHTMIFMPTLFFFIIFFPCATPFTFPHHCYCVQVQVFVRFRLFYIQPSWMCSSHHYRNVFHALRSFWSPWYP